MGFYIFLPHDWLDYFIRPRFQFRLFHYFVAVVLCTRNKSIKPLRILSLFIGQNRSMCGGTAAFFPCWIHWAFGGIKEVFMHLIESHSICIGRCRSFASRFHYTKLSQVVNELFCCCCVRRCVRPTLISCSPLKLYESKLFGVVYCLFISIGIFADEWSLWSCFFFFFSIFVGLNWNMHHQKFIITQYRTEIVWCAVFI